MTALLPPRSVLGVIHVQALPGTPHSRLRVGDIVTRAVEEARLLTAAGFHGIVVENMHDRPYVWGTQGPEIVAAMTRIAVAVREVAVRDGAPLPLGIQILAGGNAEALAVALASDAQFIRAENFVFAHVADEGLISRAEAGPLLRYRRQIGADHVRIFTDVKKKHACHAITADVSIGEMAEAAEFFGSDAIIVSGSATGKPTDVADLDAVRAATQLAVLVGSGATAASVRRLLEHAHGVIVGSFVKRDGVWYNPPDPARCRELLDAARQS